MKNKTSKTTVILFGLCAVLWSARAVFEVAHQTYTDSVFWFCANLACAILWDVSFLIVLKRYRENNDE